MLTTDVHWFAGNTRVVGQPQLALFREELKNHLSDNFSVILKERKLPLSLLQDHQKVLL
jgi:nuclear GTP-binding protein